MSEQKISTELGAIAGRILVFGGVYSNLQALESLKKWADDHHIQPSNVFCTGDVLGYCAQPLETLQLLSEWNIHTIAGNVELQLRNDEDDCGCAFTEGGRCDVLSRNWYQYTRSKMNEKALEWLRALPHHIRFTYQGKRVVVVHGSWHETAAFVFNSTPWTIKEKNLKDAGAEVILAGHSGLPFESTQAGLQWLNAGALGMPANNGSAATWFLTLDGNKSETIVPLFHQLPYNNEMASLLMRREGLPDAYASTLVSGIWDNCEILPAEEAAAQGRPLLIGTSGN